MSFFILSDLFFFFFLTLDLFLRATLQGWKESIGFPDAELYAESFEKNFIKKSNILEACQSLKILAVAIRNHIISFQFLLISEHFRTTQENDNWSIRSKKLAVIGKNVFFRLSHKERFFFKKLKKNL